MNKLETKTKERETYMKYYKKIDFTHVYLGHEAADLFKDAENRRTLIGVYKFMSCRRVL